MVQAASRQMAQAVSKAPTEQPSWLAALQAGDEQAWRRFVDRYSGRIYRYFHNNAPDGEDVDLFFIVLALNIFGDILRDALDPKLRK